MKGVHVELMLLLLRKLYVHVCSFRCRCLFSPFHKIIIITWSNYWLFWHLGFESLTHAHTNFFSLCDDEERILRFYNLLFRSLHTVQIGKWMNWLWFWLGLFSGSNVGQLSGNLFGGHNVAQTTIVGISLHDSRRMADTLADTQSILIYNSLANRINSRDFTQLAHFNFFFAVLLSCKATTLFSFLIRHSARCRMIFWRYDMAWYKYAMTAPKCNAHYMSSLSVESEVGCGGMRSRVFWHFGIASMNSESSHENHGTIIGEK